MNTHSAAPGRQHLLPWTRLGALLASGLITAGVTLVFLDLYGIKRSTQIERLQAQADLAYRLVQRAVVSQEARDQLGADLAIMDAALVSNGQLIDTPHVVWQPHAAAMLAAGLQTAGTGANAPALGSEQSTSTPTDQQRLVSANGWDAVLRQVPFPLIDGTTGTLVVATPTSDWLDALENAKVRHHLLLTGFLLGLLLLGGLGVIDAFRRQVRRLSWQVRRDFEHLTMSKSAAASTDDELTMLATGVQQLKHELSIRDAQIHELAFSDALTALPNRQRFVHRLESMFQALQTPEFAGQAIVVVILNLNRFRRVNDTLGHETGDSVLRLVAQRLKNLHPDDVPARVDGNEFAAAFFTDEAGALSKAQHYTASIRTSLESPIRLNGTDIDIRVTAGIAFSSLQDDANDLIRRAYISLTSAREGMQEHAIFEPGMDNGQALDLSLLGQMRAAIRRNELVLHYQPKVALSSGRTSGAEALARWAHPTRGMLPPNSFIDFAETNGFIQHITRWTLRQAFSDFNALAAGREDFTLSVNISAYDVLDPTLPVYLGELARECGVRPQGIVLEVTETAVMHSMEQSCDALNRIREIGVKLSIDDFGTGYSSLAYIGSLPANEIKIDRSFVVALHQSGDRAAILKAAIDIGRSLGLDVVAEGIETGEIAATLKAWGCTTGQGFFFARSLPLQDFLKWEQGRGDAASELTTGAHRSDPVASLDPRLAQMEAASVAGLAAAGVSP